MKNRFAHSVTSVVLAGCALSCGDAVISSSPEDPEVPGDDPASDGGGGVSGGVDPGCPVGAIRWASSPNRVYVTGPATCTLTDLARGVTREVLELVDAPGKKWMLRANIFLERGARLRLLGEAAGGDVNELRLMSGDEKVHIRAEWGVIEIDGVHVTSWDEHLGGPDLKPDEHGRAYLMVRSFLDPDGVTVRRSRMDIRRSDIGYLGYDGDEAYGLTWRVNEESAAFLDRVDVGGDILDSRIHHNYFGVYTWGAQGMHIEGNEIANNLHYGLDPHDDSDGLVISDNDIHHNGDDGLICSKRCDGLLVAGNRVWANAGSGILLHLAATGWTVEDNQSHHNGAAGIALIESSQNLVRRNQVHDNQRGIQVSNRSLENRIEANQIEANRDYGLYFFPGDDPQASRGRPMSNVVSGNTIRDNRLALGVTEADDNVFEGNTFADNDDEILFQDARSNRLVRNDIASSSVILTKTTDSDARASTIVTPMGAPLSVLIYGEATTAFRDPERRAYAVEGLSEETRVTAGESALDLDSTEITSPRTVAPMPLVAEIASGELRLVPTGPASWTARSTSGSVATRFRVGGLQPSAEHVVLRDGATLTTARADAGGNLSFTDAVGTAARTYAVERR